MTCPTCGTLNPAGMRYCGMCGRALDGTSGSRERRRVSVVFVDIAAFSDLTRDQDPEDLRDLADEVLTVVAGVIEDYDGYVDAFRGDGLIALFGAPHSHPDDPERAVRAAAASLRAIERVGAGRGTPLRGRAGVNTGVVIAGAIGSGRVRDYTVMGSAVNLAARLEAAALPGQVWVGPETFRAVRHRLSFETTDELTLLGFPDVRRAYQLVREDDARSTDPYAHLAFVGRSAQLSRLRAARERVATTGRAHELWVVGEAGAGKSRLIREAFPDEVAYGTIPGGVGDRAPNGAGHRTDGVLWLRVPVGAQPPWPQLAQAVFGIDEAAQSPASRQRIERELAELLPGEPRWWRAILASLNLVDERPWRRMDRRGTDRAALAWADLLAARARAGWSRSGPIESERADAVRGTSVRPGSWVLVVDDDPHNPDLNAFLGLVREVHAPILVVRAGRARHVPSRADRVTVAPLSTEDSLALVRQLIEPPMETAARTLVSQLGGVPAHLIELGRALSHQEEGAVSTSLAGLLQARLDRLDPPARTLLAHASLTGERVWDGLLRELAPNRRGKLIEDLVRDKLLVPEPGSSLPGQREYRFQSELLRRAVMRMVPFAERPPVHVRIGTWLEVHAPLALSETIGEQFAEGGAVEAAYAHWMAAADLHGGAGDADQVDRLFGRILGLAVDGELRGQAALAWAQHRLESGDVAGAAEAIAVARPSIETCAPEPCERLRAIAERLEGEIEGARRERTASLDALDASGVADAPRGAPDDARADG